LATNNFESSNRAVRMKGIPEKYRYPSRWLIGT
jgi:hypothetical protein